MRRIPPTRRLCPRIAHRQALRENLDAAGARLEVEAKARAKEEQPAYEKKKRTHEARNGQGRLP